MNSYTIIQIGNGNHTNQNIGEYCFKYYCVAIEFEHIHERLPEHGGVLNEAIRYPLSFIDNE